MNPVCAPKNDTHSWSVAQFETYRPLLTDFLKGRIIPLLDAGECRRILIRAPVKSGKREMVEYLAIRDYAHNPTRIHAFVSAFHRIADESQRKELRNHNLHVFSLVSHGKSVECLNWILEKTAERMQIVIHLDECDFASGDRQILSHLYSNIRDHQNVTTILYSATPQEVLFSGEIEEEEYQGMIDEMIHIGQRIEYQPPPSFCGPSRFLDAELVHEATPFFEKNRHGLTLTPQGVEIMTNLRASMHTGRNILVLRLSYAEMGGTRSDRKDRKAIYHFLKGWETIPELSDCIILADDKEKDIPDSVITDKILWSNRRYWIRQTKEVPIIVVIDQTSSRSTEWSCHDRIFAMHDYRNSFVFSVLSQAQERVNHYEDRYGGFQPVRIYGHLKTFLLSAGRISYGEYLHNEWTNKKVDKRTAVSLGLDGDYYVIRRNNASKDIHPDYSEYYTEEESEHILKELGCSDRIKVSARVKGGTKSVRVFGCEFYPCPDLNFDNFKTRLLKDKADDQKFKKRKFTNPFIESVEQNDGQVDGKYKGYLRGWYVLDYDTQVKTQSGWAIAKNEVRLTICYQGDVLGIAVRYDTGLTEEQNSMAAYRSMYSN
jgi:hypothetical protein